MVTESNGKLPIALQVWDNSARLSLPVGLLVWLIFLVLTCLCSAFWVKNHTSARWVLGGFIASHVLVVLFANLNLFVMRKGIVSLSHVLCWSPGWVYVMVDCFGRTPNTPFLVWGYLLVLLIAIAFVFDLRDSVTFVYYLVRGEVPTTHDSNS